MRAGRTGMRVLSILAAMLMLMVGFAAGFAACIHEQHALGGDAGARQFKQAGDAPPEVRAGVMATLQAFQNGYSRRDTGEVDNFLRSTFDTSADVLALGTNQFEWKRGYPAVAAMVYGDWKGWGDVRLNTETPIIDSAGDVAWLATAGTVQFGTAKRPIRFSAVLTRKGDKWLFRQVQFQWEEREVRSGDLLHAGTYVDLLRGAYRKVVPEAAASHPSAQ